VEFIRVTKNVQSPEESNRFQKVFVSYLKMDALQGMTSMERCTEVRYTRYRNSFLTIWHVFLVMMPSVELANCFVLVFFAFDPEDEGDMFRRNVDFQRTTSH
jgi:hypothetical protein